jgi:serine protease Do
MRLAPTPLPTAFLAGLLLACAGDQRGSVVDTASAQAATQSPAATTEMVHDSRRTAIVEAVRRVSPSVVSIHVRSRRTVQPEAGMFWDFFFAPSGREELVDGFGTGFVLRADGIIATNQHVVAEAEQVTVSFADGTEVDARILGEDATTDVAVLKVERSGLAVPPLGQSSNLLIGEWVIAVGNPYAYLLGNAEPTVTAGVISATGRNILPNRQQTGLYLDMIQTDAAINPGNSGGPLTNALGEVVGMNSSIFSSSGGSIGLGFAIPVERVRRVVDEIIRRGSVRRAWVGLDVAGAEAMRDWKAQGGVLVRQVAPGGPAAQAGIAAGDVLTAANGRTLRNFLDWEAVKLDLAVGDTIGVSVRRDTRTVTRRVRTGDLPTVTATRVSVLQGVDLVTVTPGVRGERSLRAERGALIVRITPEVRRQTGLTEGDVIIGLNRTPVTSAEDAARLLQSIRPRQAFRLYFERNGQTGYTDRAFP